MTTVYVVAAFWFLSALIPTIVANRLKISNALMEIIIGAIVGFIAFKTGFLAPFTYKTFIASRFLLPSHLLEKPVLDDQLPEIIKVNMVKH